MSKSSCPPPDFEIAEKQVYINTIMRFLDRKTSKRRTNWIYQIKPFIKENSASPREVGWDSK
jgi:hypothetical protein